MAVKKMKTGIVGCGNISQIYLTNGKTFNDIEVVACADINMDGRAWVCRSE